MNKFILYYLMVFLCIGTVAGQTLGVTNTQYQSNGTVLANFWAIDAGGHPVTNLTAANFSVNVNGIPRPVLSIGCNTISLTPDSVSAVLTIDISSSMNAGGPRINFAKDAANLFLTNLPLGISEAAITSFNHNSFVNQDLTIIRANLTSAINSLIPSGGTNYDEAFLSPYSGAIGIAAGGSRTKKIIVFLTDGTPVSVNTQAIINQANSKGIHVFCLCLGMSAPQSLKSIANSTGGMWFENLNTMADVRNAYSHLLMYAQGYGTGCTISWKDTTICEANKTATINLLSPFISSTQVSYTQPDGLVPIATVVSSANIDLGCVGSGTHKDTVIKIVANGSATVINSITSNNNNFNIVGYQPSAPPVTLQPGTDTLKVTVRYIPTDSTVKASVFTVNSNSCTVPTINLSAGCPPNIISLDDNESLKLVFPNGTEKLISCTDTTISWTGVSPETRIILDYTTNNGSTWTNIDSNAHGLSYRWHVPDLFSNSIKIRAMVYDSLYYVGKDTIYTLGNMAYLKIDWNPQRTKFAAIKPDASIVIIDRATGNIEHTWRSNLVAGDQDSPCFEWSPSLTEDKIAFYSQFTVYLTILNPTTGVLTTLPNTQYSNLFKWSPDGTKIACVNTNDPTLPEILVVSSTGVLLNTLVEQNSSINSLAWSADGTVLASVALDSTVCLWDMTLAVPQPLPTSFNSHLDVKALAFNPLNKNKIAMFGIAYGNMVTETKIRILDLSTGNSSYNSINASPMSRNYYDLLWNSAGNKLFARFYNCVSIFNAQTNTLERVLSYSYSAAFMDNRIKSILHDSGDEIIVAYRMGGIITYNYNTGAVINSIHTINGFVSAVSFNKTGTRLAVAEVNRITIWDVQSRSIVRIIDNNMSMIYGMQWSPDGSKIAATSGLNSIIIWETNTWNIVDTIHNCSFNAYPMNCENYFDWSPNSERLAVYRNNFIDIFNTSNWTISSSFPYTVIPSYLVWDTYGIELLVGQSDNDPILRSINTVTGAVKLYNQSYPLSYCDFTAHPTWNSKGDKFIIPILCSGATLLAFEKNVSVPILNYKKDLSMVRTVEWNKKRNLVAAPCGNWDGEISIYSGRNLKLLKRDYSNYRTNSFIGGIISAKWCPDSTIVMLATGFADGRFELHYLPSVLEIIADTSDSNISILNPMVIAKNVDIGNAVVGITKDSTLSAYITNSSGLPVKVDTVIIVGTDASCFSIAPAFEPCTIPNGRQQNIGSSLHSQRYRAQNSTDKNTCALRYLDIYDNRKWSCSNRFCKS